MNITIHKEDPTFTLTEVSLHDILLILRTLQYCHFADRSEMPLFETLLAAVEAAAPNALRDFYLVADPSSSNDLTFKVKED